MRAILGTMSVKTLSVRNSELGGPESQSSAKRWMISEIGGK
jgi:hypothetical protein